MLEDLKSIWIQHHWNGITRLSILVFYVTLNPTVGYGIIPEVIYCYLFEIDRNWWNCSFWEVDLLGYEVSLENAVPFQPQIKMRKNSAWLETGEFWSRCYIGISSWRQTYCWSPITKTHTIAKLIIQNRLPKTKQTIAGPTANPTSFHIWSHTSHLHEPTSASVLDIEHLSHSHGRQFVG
jgi:hypothetical protein